MHAGTHIRGKTKVWNSNIRRDVLGVSLNGEGRHSSLLQAVTELDPEATITTIDGISAYDSITRRALLFRVAGERQALPFVRLFCSEPSVWTDNLHDSSRRRSEQGGLLDATPVLLGSMHL